VVSTAADTRTESSRTSDAGAGWDCAPGRFRSLLVGKRPKRLSWFSARVLWETRNDVLAKTLGDPTDDVRARWVDGLTDEQLTVDLGYDDFSFLLLGDTGEGDWSQYALVPPLEAKGADAKFLFICSDVMYPLANVNAYAPKFYIPYKSLEMPIYAIPGNHDWYDGLEAFMRHFCDREAIGRAWSRFPSRGFVRDVLWRRPPRFKQPKFDEARAHRSSETQRQPKQQQGPYFVIETQRLRLVCIDTGITKDLDHAQGEWLLRVSSGSPKPKVLLSGTPIYVDNKCQPLEIIGGAGGFETVDAIVRHAPHNYVAVIGGDIHNYQRYPVDVDGRTIQYIVSGGGGAFMHGTHEIPPIDPDACGGVTEEQFRCYPLRRDSLAAFSRLLAKRIPFCKGYALTPDEAAQALIERYPSITPTRPIRTKADKRRLATVGAFLMPSGRTFHKWLSPFFDWDDPPFFKNFLRLDVNGDGLRVRCYGVTGCVDREDDPSIEDEIAIPLVDSRVSAQ
jgi:hypothetical protein